MRQLPTIEGKVDGIVGLDPVVLQCRQCGVTATREGRRGLWSLVVIDGWKFHVCEGRDGKRRCPDCLAAVEAACSNRGRHQ